MGKLKLSLGFIACIDLFSIGYRRSLDVSSHVDD